MIVWCCCQLRYSRCWRTPYAFSHHYLSIITFSTSFFACFFFLMIRRPPRSTLFPTRRSSDLSGSTSKRSQIYSRYLWEREREQTRRLKEGCYSEHQAQHLLYLLEIVFLCAANHNNNKSTTHKEQERKLASVQFKILCSSVKQWYYDKTLRIKPRHLTSSFLYLWLFEKHTNPTPKKQTKNHDFCGGKAQKFISFKEPCFTVNKKPKESQKS